MILKLGHGHAVAFLDGHVQCIMHFIHSLREIMTGSWQPTHYYCLRYKSARCQNISG